LCARWDMLTFFYLLCVRSISNSLQSRLMPVVLVALTLFWLSPQAIAADTNGEIRAFVEGVNQASMGFFSSGSEADARDRCRALLAWAFDVPAMAKEAFGRAWDEAPDEKRTELLEAFEQDIISAYLRRMRPKGTTLTFVGQRPPVGGDQLAASRRNVPGKEDQIWIWWLHPDGQSWRVVDLLLDGHSAVNSARQEYASVLESNKGDIDALIAFMRKRAVAVQ